MADLEENLFPLVLVDDFEVAGEPAVIEGRPVPGHEHLAYSVTAVQDPDHPLLYRVDVEISWNSEGAKQSRKFSTLLLREVPFGERLRLKFVEKVEVKPPADAPLEEPAPGEEDR